MAADRDQQQLGFTLSSPIVMWSAALLGAAATGYLLWVVLGGFNEAESSPEDTPLESGSNEVTTMANGQTVKVNKNSPPAEYPYVEVEPGKYLRADAGRSYLAMRAAARADGVDLPVSTAYRSVAWQWVLWNAWQAYKSGKGPWAPLAAKPDGNGPHQRGRALDLFGFDRTKSNYDARRDAWMKANAAKYGWKQTGLTFSSKEPWHFYFVGSAQYPVQDSLVGQPAQLLVA